MTRSGESGLTLLETLVSLGVMAIIALMLASGMSSLIGLSARSSSHSSAANQISARLLTREVIDYAADAPFPGFPALGLQGDAHSLIVESWYAKSPFWPGSPTVLTLSADREGKIIAAIAGSDEDARPFVLTETLSDGGGLAIRYYGFAPGALAPTWHDAWSTQSGLPLLVNITTAEPSQDFPPLFVRPGRSNTQSEISLSSLVPPALPSRP